MCLKSVEKADCELWRFGRTNSKNRSRKRDAVLCPIPRFSGWIFWDSKEWSVRPDVKFEIGRHRQKVRKSTTSQFRLQSDIACLLRPTPLARRLERRLNYNSLQLIVYINIGVASYGELGHVPSPLDFQLVILGITRFTDSDENVQ